MSDEMPPQPKTTQLPAADKTEILLAEMKVLMVGGFGHVNERLDQQEVTLRKVADDGVETNTRLTRVEVRLESAESGVKDLEARIGRTSSRVKQVSQQDLEQDAQLAQERAAREELAGKVDKLLSIGERLEKVTKNPTAKVLAGMLATAAITWLAAHNATPPQVAAPAPTHVDAGAP